MAHLDSHVSKSRLHSFRQCPLCLWNEIHRRDLAQEPDAGAQHLFDEGTRVGELTRKRYPGGKLIDAYQKDSPDWIPASTGMMMNDNAVRLTIQALSDPSIPAIFEAAFIADNTLFRCDILKRVGSRKWEM
jgi:hypothetical protein